jgi:hypothetical protein
MLHTHLARCMIGTQGENKTMLAGCSQALTSGAPRFSISRSLVAAIWIGALRIATMCAQVADADTPIEVYGRLPAVEDLALSPDGTRLALVNTSGDQRNLYIRPSAENRALGAARGGGLDSDGIRRER